MCVITIKKYSSFYRIFAELLTCIIYINLNTEFRLIILSSKFPIRAFIYRVLLIFRLLFYFLEFLW